MRATDEPRNGSDFTEVTKPSCFGVRHALCVLGFLIITSAYTMRSNLSVAIVAMVNKTATSNESTTNACPWPADYDPGESYYTTGEFDWNEQIQGVVLGSFYYGYFLTNIIGGRMAERWGGKVVVGLGIGLTAVFTVLSPLAARASTWLFITVRILEGCSEGVVFPGMNVLITDWFPNSERSKFASLIYLGTQFGSVVALPVSGWLCDTTFLGGWPSVFYVFGSFGIMLMFFWFWFVRDDPRQHPRISDGELSYILSGCPNAEKRKERVTVPWRSIFTSKAFWAITIMHFGNNWGFYTLLTELPTYLDQILHFNIKSNGLLSALPYLGAWIFGTAFGRVTDYLISKNSLSISSLRRLAMIVGGYGPMTCLIIMCFVNCHSTLALFFLILSGSANGAVYCGYMCSHADISPQFAGTLMGITNTFATIPGFMSPVLTGAITEDNQTLWAWRTVFLIAAVMYGVSVTLYIIFISADVQPWNDDTTTKSKKEISHGRYDNKNQEADKTRY